MDRILLLLSAICTVGSLIVTAVYTRLTYKILKANEQVVAISEAQIRSQSRPHVVIRALSRPASRVLQLSIASTGRTAAKNLRLVLEPDFHRFGRDDESESLRHQPVFMGETACFPPGMDLVYDLGPANELSQPELSNISPLQFTVTATYQGDADQYKEKTIIDLAVFGKTTIGAYGPVYELQKINASLVGICEAIGRQVKQ